MHAFICFIFATLTCVIMAKPSPTLIPNDDPLWREYKLRFKKFYEDPNEEVGRYVIWLEHNKEIDAHNSDPSQTYKRGINHFSDMSHVEFHAKNSGCLKVPKHILEGNATDGSHWVRPSNVDIPETVDWRTAGLVTPIKNQGQCGSCWAFSSTGSLEGQIFKKTGRLPSLSEQNLVDCTQKYGNEGCRGGWYENSFKYIRDNKGIDSETGYPYYARELGYCYYNAQYNTASDTGFVDLPANDENALKEAVATIGPISVAIDATRPGFASYRSGVYVDASCGNTIYNLDHAVLVVGYGTENGVDYWLVKNSWGTYWGDAGYIKMARNRNNQCGIACKASYPLV